MEAHSVSRLIGAPPGYVGHDDGGQLTDAVAAEPECVVLFDEVEKAHPKLHNLMLQILEEGALTDSKGRRVSFELTIVVMTSNCGAEEVTSATRAVGFGGTPTIGRAALEVITEDALARTFSPEFLGRIGDIVVFDELSRQTVERVAQKKLAELAERGAVAACGSASRGPWPAGSPGEGSAPSAVPVSFGASSSARSSRGSPTCCSPAAGTRSSSGRAAASSASTPPERRAAGHSSATARPLAC